MRKVKWGVLGVAKIAARRVIPSMQRGEWCEIAAIASRDLGRAKTAAETLGIAKAYGSYDELLADPRIEAVYNPLPHHLHVPWSIRAAEAGKHVLCEKPVGLNTAEVHRLIAARDRAGVLIGEAFMVQLHPQWIRAVELVRCGRIGELRSAVGTFSYFNEDPTDIRNVFEYGGGALMDIGCYPIKTSRWVFGEEPVRVIGSFDRDPRFGNIDRLTSAILEFPSGHCAFTCATQAVYNQSMRFYGTKGSVELEVPYNPTPGGPSRIRLDDGAAVEEIAPCDQYTLQGDHFSRAIREGGRPAVPLEDSVCNMAVIDALFRSGDSGRWETPQNGAPA